LGVERNIGSMLLAVDLFGFTRTREKLNYQYFSVKDLYQVDP